MEYIYARFFVIIALVKSVIVSADDANDLYSGLRNSASRPNRPPDDGQYATSEFATPSEPRDDASTREAVLDKREVRAFDSKTLYDKKERRWCLQVETPRASVCVGGSTKRGGIRNGGVSEYGNELLTRLSRSHYNREDDFLRFGRSNFNLFSRYDRGRDNFIRLGRAKANRQQTSQPVDVSENVAFTERGAKRDIFAHDAQPLSKYRNIIRLGRAADFFGHGRLSRKADNFMRFGRERNGIGHCQGCPKRSTPNGMDRIAERSTRKMDHFLRLGRQLEDDSLEWAEEPKQPDNLDLISEYQKCNKNDELSWTDVETCLAQNGIKLRYLKDGSRSNSAPSGLPETRHLAREARRNGLYLRFGRSFDDANDDVSSELTQKRRSNLSPNTLRFGRSDGYGPDVVGRMGSYQTSGTYNGDGSTYRINETN